MRSRTWTLRPWTERSCWTSLHCRRRRRCCCCLRPRTERRRSWWTSLHCRRRGRWRWSRRAGEPPLLLTVSKTFWLPMTTEPYPRIISLIPSPTMLQSMKELRVQIYEHLLLPTGTLKQGLIKTIVRKMKLITKPYQKIGWGWKYWSRILNITT